MWSLLHDHGKLWVWMLLSKYCPSWRVFSATARPYDSCIWKGIIKTIAVLKDGYQVKVGKGEVSLWYDRWTANGPICNQIPYVNIQDADLRVKDIVGASGWETSNLATMLPSQVLNDIQSVPFFLHEDIPDMMIWKQETSGQYSAKSGYEWLCSLNHQSPSDKSWMWVWRLKVPDKIKVFIWLLGHGALLTNCEHTRRHITLDPICDRCGLSMEDILHCLKDCPKSRNIWVWLRLWELDFFEENDTFTWIMKGAASSFATVFLAGIWWIWRARCREILTRDPWPEWEVLRNINLMAQDISSFLMQSSVGTSQPRHVSWIRPPPNGFKLDVDGSALGNPGRAGFGGLIRNDDGQWVKGFSGFVGIATNLHAELLALFHGLKLA